MAEEHPALPGTPQRSFPPNMVQFLRTLEQMQVQFSQMADQKASMLMGAALVVFSLCLAQLRAGGGMLVPVAILGVSAFASAWCAILTVLPRGTTGKRSVGANDNILFFGVFAHMPQEEFIDRVLDGMASDESTFRMMLRDMHQAGLVLHRHKYRLLGIAYRVFLVGMVMTALAVGLELVSGLRI